MSKPPVIADEAERQRALDDSGLLQAVRVPILDDIVALAAHICAVPTAFVSLIDGQRQFLRASVGLDVVETARDDSFCAHTIAGKGIMIVPDAQLDPRFADNRLVTGPPFIRFYAGMPLILGERHAAGALCIVDYRPRVAEPPMLELLERLGRLATLHINEYRRARER